jgi:hypothetical protein
MNLDCTRETTAQTKQEQQRHGSSDGRDVVSDCVSSGSIVLLWRMRLCGHARCGAASEPQAMAAIAAIYIYIYIYIYLYRTSSIHAICKVGSALKRDLFTSPKENVEVLLSVWKKEKGNAPLTLYSCSFPCGAFVARVVDLLDALLQRLRPQSAPSCRGWCSGTEPKSLRP